MICQESKAYRVKLSVSSCAPSFVASEEHSSQGKFDTKYDVWWQNPSKKSESVMLSKTTSLSTRSPTASLKKILKVVVMCWPKNLQKPSQEHQIEKSSKSAQRITREVPVWRHSDGGGWWVKVVLEINPHKTIASRYMRAKSLHKKIQKKRQKPRRPSEQSHALRFAKTTSPPKKKKTLQDTKKQNSTS